MHGQTASIPLSAKEIITYRDGLTGEQLNLDDIELSHKQHQTRFQNHTPSARSKVPKGQHALNIDR